MPFASSTPRKPPREQRGVGGIGMEAPLADVGLAPGVLQDGNVPAFGRAHQRAHARVARVVRDLELDAAEAAAADAALELRFDVPRAERRLEAAEGDEEIRVRADDAVRGVVD